MKLEEIFESRVKSIADLAVKPKKKPSAIQQRQRTMRQHQFRGSVGGDAGNYRSGRG